MLFYHVCFFFISKCLMSVMSGGSVYCMCSVGHNKLLNMWLWGYYCVVHNVVFLCPSGSNGCIHTIYFRFSLCVCVNSAWPIVRSQGVTMTCEILTIILTFNQALFHQPLSSAFLLKENKWEDIYISMGEGEIIKDIR